MQDFCNLTTEEKEIISKTIITSIMNEVKEFYMGNNLHHKNAYYMLTWDFIGSRIIDILKSTRLKVKKVERGVHTFDLIIDEENSTAYSIMKKSNFYRVKNNKKFSHYLWALTSINSDIAIEEGQMNLFSIDTAQLYREETKRKLLSDVESIITRYCTIIINDDNRQFPSIELHVFDMNLNDIYQETWKESLTIDYNFGFDDADEEIIVPNIKIKDDKDENENKNKMKFKDNKKEEKNKKEG